MVMKFVGLSGSLRKQAYSTAILRSIGELMPVESNFDLMTIADIPLFNDDDDGDAPPPPVNDLRRAVADADGLIVISPEYNHGMSGVLKNALDWLSRPAASSCLIGKPVLTMTASPSPLGGVRAQQQLNETFIATRSALVIRRQIVIGSVAEKMADGRLVDQPTLDFIQQGLIDLRGHCAA